MGRPLRWQPGRSVVEVTCRTLLGHYFLRPSETVNRRILGVLGRAQERYDVAIHAYVFLSSHYHMLLAADDANAISGFMGYVQSNIAREVGRLVGWGEKFWSRRYRSIPVSDEPQAQLQRLEYLLSQGPKEGLVARPEDWPGAASTMALLAGEEEVEGEWIDRTALYRCRRKNPDAEPGEFVSFPTVHLAPLPALEPLSPEARSRWIRECCDRIAATYAQEHEREGREVLGARAVRMQNPLERPRQLKRSPAPRFHAATREAFRELLNGYRAFVAAYREAAERLRLTGGRDPTGFPPGCFPPSLPFVPA